MKKIILIFIIFVCTGCYDYNELENLSIVSAIGIDYIDNNYNLTFQILSDHQSALEDNTPQVLFVESQGSSLLEAFNNADFLVAKKLYFKHVELLVIGETLAYEGLDKTTDYILKNSNFNNDFYSVIANNSTAKELLSRNAIGEMIPSKSIIKLMKSDIETSGTARTQFFEQSISSALTSGEEMVITSMVPNNTENIKLNGLAVFESFKLKGFLSLDNSKIYNLLTNNIGRVNYNIKCTNEDNSVLISISDSKAKIKAKNNSININVEISASLVENNCQELEEKELTKIIKNFFATETDNLIQSSYYYDTDILGFGSIYYKKYRFYEDSAWKKLKYTKDISINLKHNNLSYEVVK